MTANKGVAFLEAPAIGKATKLKVSASNNIGEGTMSEEIVLTSAALPSKPFDMKIITYGPAVNFTDPDRKPLNPSETYYLYF